MFSQAEIPLHDVSDAEILICFLDALIRNYPILAV